MLGAMAPVVFIATGSNLYVSLNEFGRSLILGFQYIFVP